jgi:hypothetical protein
MNTYDVAVAGGGPIGCFTAQHLASKGRHVAVFEEHDTIGQPVHCAGLVTQRVFDISQISPSGIIQNTVYGAHIHSPSGEILSIGGDKIHALLERLRPEGPGAFNITQFAESIGREFSKKFQSAFRKKIEEIQSKYKRQVSRLVSALPSEPSRGSFQGPNPSCKREDMLEMAEFAAEQDAPVEITYKRSDREPLVEKVIPKKVVGDRIFAFSEKRQRLRSYRLERIEQIRLLGQEA